MGGPGSGNRSHHGAISHTDEFRTLDVRRFEREGMLWPGHRATWQWTRNGEELASIQMRAGHDRVVLMYRHRRGGGGWTDAEYPVYIERTACNLGGSRPWFLCPAVGCDRRVAILYCRGIFACRHCLRLAYGSAREGAGDRATRRADRVRARLGWKPGIFDGYGGKPKWMRWRTFYRLTSEYDRLVNRAVHSLAFKFGLLERINSAEFFERP